MIVTAWKGSTFGVRIQRKDVSRHFSREWEIVELILDNDIVIINLSKSFWKKCPELRTRFIGDWLQKKGLVPWPKLKPPKLRLGHLKGKRFRLTEFDN